MEKNKFLNSIKNKFSRFAKNLWGLLLATILISGQSFGQCTHTFTGYDSYGDGWNGASVMIMVNNQPVGGIAMTTGTSESVTFQASDGDVIKLDWIPGDYDYEISWECMDGANNTIAMGVYGDAGVGAGACPLPTPCATLDYAQDFETGSTFLTATTGSQSIVSIDGTAANASIYGLHMEGNTYTGWSSSYSTGPDAFNNSPTHIASVSREICAPSQPTVTLKFNKMQTYTYNPNYSWFRVTVDGNPIADVNGRTYFNGTNNVWGPMEYNLSPYTGSAFTLAFETCNKYYTGYTTVGMGGDASYIDDITIGQSSGLSPPTVPGLISGTDYPNSGQTIIYSVGPVSGADTYTWTAPTGWLIMGGQGTTSITVKSNNNAGTISVTATNIAGTSLPSTLTVTSAVLVTSYPYETAFENETNDVTTASATGFTFNENGWRNVTGDDGDWRTDAGGTGTTNSGPGGGASSGVSDHYPGTSSGKYIYTEASTPNYPSKEFHLWSPPFDLTSLTSPTLTFWYSMYSVSGAQMALQYSLDNGNTFESLNLPFMCVTTYPIAVIYQNMGTSWRQGLVDLSSLQSNSNVMFRFIIQTGTSWDSDVCLDDIKLVDAANTSVDVGENITLGSSAYDNAYGLILNGSSSQTIVPAGYNISHITINNSNGVTIEGSDLKIDNTLTLTNGVLTTGTNKVIISNTSTSSLIGGSNTAFINGNLRRYLATNTDTYSFPIGNGTGTGNYQKVDLINGSLVGVGYIDASTSDMGGGNMTELSPQNAQWNGTILAEVYDKNWTLTPNTQPTGGTFGVNLYLNGVGGGTLLDDEFTILKRPTGSTTWGDWDAFNSTTTIPAAGQPGRTVADGFMQKSGFTSFSDFGGGGGGGGPLPIVLTSWNAEIVGESTSLTWTVESQINNDFYTIHRSLDCEKWEEVAKVAGAGNSNMTMEYQIFDESPYIGQSYYRLMQTDYDGRYEMFRPIGIFWDKPIKLSINPNPVEEVLTLYLSETLRGVTHITIFNTKGQKIYSKGFIGNWKVIELDVAEYQKGYYLLDVDHNHRKGTLKFIKE